MNQRPRRPCRSGSVARNLQSGQVLRDARMFSTKVVFQADERLFLRDRNGVDLTIKLESSTGPIETNGALVASAPRFTTKTFLSVLYAGVCRVGAKHGLQVPQSVFGLMHEYLVVRCLSIGTPVQVLDLLADTVSWRPRERLLVMRKMCSIQVTILPGYHPIEIACDARQSSRAVVRQVLRTTFGEQGETFFDPANYELCLTAASTTTSKDNDPTALDWAGLGPQAPPTTPNASNSWCWFDDQYNFLYEVDVSVWRTVWLRKRFFFGPNAAYLSSTTPVQSDAATFDMYQDLAECRQTILRLVRDYSTDERSLDHAVRRLTANIASETALLSACPAACPNRTEDYCRSHTVSAPAKALDKHVKVRALFDTLTTHLRSVTVTSAVPLDADDGDTARGPLVFTISPEAKTCAKHLFDVRLSCFRCLLLVRIGHETFLPLALMNGRLLFTRVENQHRGGAVSSESRTAARATTKTIDKALFLITAAGSYHVKNTLQKSRVVPHDTGTTTAAIVCSPVPRRRTGAGGAGASSRAEAPLTIPVQLKDYVCWRRDNAAHGGVGGGLLKRRLIAGSYRSKSDNDVFRYLSINVRNCTPNSIGHLLSNYASLYALNTMTVGDRSAITLILNGHGVRSVLTMIRAVHGQAADKTSLCRVVPPQTPTTARQSLKTARSELRASFVAPAAPAVPPPTDITARVRRTIDQNYANMKYIDAYMQQTIGEGLPMFGVLDALYQQRDDPGNLERILDVMQNIYKHLPYLLNQLLFMQKYEVHDTVVKLL